MEKLSITGHSARVYFPGVLGESKVIADLLSKIYMLSLDDGPVVLVGEVGTGKSYYSSCILNMNKRDSFKAEVIDCEVHDEDFVYSILSKSKRQRKKILVENINFLSNPGQDLLIKCIDKVLLADRTKCSVCRSKIIMTSRVNLNELYFNNKISDGLYYRILNYQIELPPLRTLNEDITFIAEQYCKDFISIDISKKALEKISNHGWPGNFTELFSFLKSMAIYDNSKIEDHDVDIYLNKASINSKYGHIRSINFADLCSFNIDEYVSYIEKNIIIEALYESRGVQSVAAKLLGIKERSLWHRIKKFNISVNKY